jgi:hypothetical protein
MVVCAQETETRSPTDVKKRKTGARKIAGARITQRNANRLGRLQVDYVFQRVELGRRELTPEWKVEWDGDDTPRFRFYIRKLAIVAYAEICGEGKFTTANWPRIVNAAIAAGVAAGIATIIAMPPAALPVFQAEFRRQLHGKRYGTGDDSVQVAISVHQEANWPWCLCGPASMECAGHCFRIL